jgi:hypothetical protein
VAAKLGRQLGVVAWDDQVPLVGCIGAAHTPRVAALACGNEGQQIAWDPRREWRNAAEPAVHVQEVVAGG